MTDELDPKRPLSRLAVDVASRVHVEVGHDLTVTLEVRYGRGANRASSPGSRWATAAHCGPA
jgi:hypothetical protein